MFRRHASKYLSAFTQGELSSGQASSVAAHLRSCDRCRNELDEIEWGISLAKHLPTLPAPSGLSGAMENLFQSGNLTAPASPQRRALRQALWVAMPLAAAIVAVLCGVLWYQKLRDPISIEANTRRVTRLEALALDLHLQQRRGLQQFDFVTDEPETISEWAMEKTGLEFFWAQQPDEDQHQYKLEGAKVLPTSSGPILAVFFRVDEVPVTLTTANVRSLAKGEAPSKGILQKKIFHRFDSSSGTNLLSWTRDDQSYVFASDLPNLGRGACFVCHTNQRRRSLIGNAKLTH
jgi:anti-sigma factor RsiW